MVKLRFRSSPFVQRWRFGFYILMYELFRLLVGPAKQRFLFLSDSRTDYSGNIAYLRDELRKDHPDVRYDGVFKRELKARRSFVDWFRLPYLMARASAIVVDDYYPLLYSIRVDRRTRVVQVWHATGAFKTVGFSREGKPGGPFAGSNVHRGYTDAVVSSEAIRGNYAEAFRMSIDQVHAWGVPRTDAFFDHERVERVAREQRMRLGIGPTTKVVLFAPTFRGNGQKSAYFDFDSVDWRLLASTLGEEYVVLVKMHPFVRTNGQLDGIEGVVDVSSEREINDLLMAADVLVTDYSSTVFEFGLLRRPMVFFCPDLDEYRESRDFYYPVDDYLVGPIVRTTDKLVAAIQNAEATSRLDQFVDFFCGACDGHSSRRVVERILERAKDEGALGER